MRRPRERARRPRARGDARASYPGSSGDARRCGEKVHAFNTHSHGRPKNPRKYSLSASAIAASREMARSPSHVATYSSASGADIARDARTSAGATTLSPGVTR